MYKILLVEDDEMNQLVTVRTLQRQGHRVLIANNGVAALELAAAEDFDAILMDCQMPMMDGFQATAAIREREAAGMLFHTPIIGLSARAMDGDREAAIAVGMDDYLTKPIRADRLCAALRQWIEGPPADDENPATISTS